MATPIAYGADWSARPIYGDVLARYRYTDGQGTPHPLSLVLRYADFDGQRLSYLTADEYESHLRAGIRSLLIYQRTTRDPDGGEPRGREFGRAAVAYARRIGYREGEPIFGTADAPIGAYNLDIVEAFFRGFAGEVRAAGFAAGGYGFRDVVYRLQDRDVVDVLWLCGAESGWRPGIAIYQWNNGRIYPDGVECDLVKQFEPIGDDDMITTQDKTDIINGTAAAVFGRPTLQIQYAGGRISVSFQGAVDMLDFRAQSTNALIEKLAKAVDVIGTAVAGLVSSGVGVDLSDADLAVLTGSLSDDLDELKRQQLAQLEEHAAEMREQLRQSVHDLAAELNGQDEAGQLRVLSRFFGLAVDAVDHAPATT